MKIIDQFFGVHPGRLIMPDDYLTGDPMPLIVYTAGRDEHISDGTLSKLDYLYNNNAALTRARDGLLNGIGDPYTGIKYRFAVLALQGAGYTPVFPSELEPVITSLVSTYKIATDRIYCTGLSLGGTIVLMSIVNAGNRYAAAVSMSTAGYNITDWKTNRKAKLWAIHGVDDIAPATNTGNSKNAVNGIWATLPGDSHYTEVTGGHCCWDRQYDPAWVQNINGVNMNIYQWMLCHVSFSDSGTGLKTTVTAPTSGTVTATRKIKNITVNYLDGTSELVSQL